MDSTDWTDAVSDALERGISTVYAPQASAYFHNARGVLLLAYSTGHQFSARALILGKNWVKKKRTAQYGLWYLVGGRHSPLVIRSYEEL